MIRIKKHNTLKESNIPIPQQLADELLNRLKIYILDWMMYHINHNLKVRQDNLSRDQKAYNSKDNQSFIDTTNQLFGSVDKYFNSSMNYINQLNELYEMLKKELPSINYKPTVKEQEHLGNWHTVLDYTRYISSNYKYYDQIINSEDLTGSNNNDIKLFVYFDYSKGGSRGDYNQRSKTISVYAPIWEKFINEIYSPQWKTNGIDFLKAINKNNYSITFLISYINKLFIEYQSVIEHELVHFVQHTFMPKIDWNKNYTTDNLDDIKNFKKYVSSDVEFFAKLKGEEVQFNYLFKNKKWTNEDFIEFIKWHSSFFEHLENADLDNYQKAVKQFYMMLKSQSNEVKEGITKLMNKNNNNNNIWMNNILVETIVNSTSNKIKERIINPHNTKDWNMEQVKIIQDLIKLNKFNLSDTNLIIRFGKVFHDWVISHKFNAPDTNEMIQALGL